MAGTDLKESQRAGWEAMRKEIMIWIKRTFTSFIYGRDRFEQWSEGWTGGHEEGDYDLE